MSASRFVGRVGGLAVALGVGAALYSGAGTASADTSESASPDSGTSRSTGDSPTGPRVRTSAAGASVGDRHANRSQRNAPRDAPPPPRADSRRASVVPNGVTPARQQADEPKATGNSISSVQGNYFTSDRMPFESGFNDLPNVVATDKGGLLGIVPILGGSGQPATFVNGSEARNAITIAVPTDTILPGTQVVGAPTVSFTHRGLGTSGAVFAQVVDKATGYVLGNVVSPVPVQLDGFKHTVSIDIGEIDYTVGAGDSLEVQITSSALAFLNASVGLIDISDVTVTLPNRTATAP